MTKNDKRDKRYLRSHISERFNTELQKLLKLLDQMGRSVLQQFDGALQALGEKDVKLAKQTIKSEKKITAYDREIQDLCYKIMSLRDPVASDLRAVLSTLQTTSDLERISDEISKIAKVAKESESIDEKVIDILLNYGTQIINNLEQILSALDTLNVVSATTLIQNKKSMRTLYLETIQKLIALDKEIEINDMTSYLFMAKGFEAIYNYSRNIAKHVIFFQEGTDL